MNTSFSYEEYADMHFVYGFCNGNTTAAVEEYRLRYRRRIPDRRVFTRVHHSDLGYGPYVNSVYSGWNSVDNYDTCASVFVVLFNGFMSLTSYFDVMYRY